MSTHDEWMKTAVKYIEPFLLQFLNSIQRYVPEPEDKDLQTQNAKLLLALKHEYMKHENPNGSRYKAIDGAWNFLITKYARDKYYGIRIDKVLWAWKELSDQWIFGTRPPGRDWIG